MEKINKEEIAKELIEKADYYIESNYLIQHKEPLEICFFIKTKKDIASWYVIGKLSNYEKDELITNLKSLNAFSGLMQKEKSCGLVIMHEVNSRIKGSLFHVFRFIAVKNKDLEVLFDKVTHFRVEF